MKHNMWRANFWYGFVIVVFALCLARLFYIQILQHGHYSSAALSDQYKEYQIPAARGVIRAQDGDRVVPIVLSQTLYTIYADPEMIKDVAKTAETTANEIGGDAKTYAELMSGEGRYVVLAKKVSAEARDKLLKHEMPGIGSQSQSYRTYPQGTLAANLLGFVDDEGVGRYGIEQALQNELAGTAGQLKAVTDINGVPLAASEDNVRVPAVAGDDVVLTIDIGMQKQAEQLLKQGLDRAQSERGSVVIMEAKTGAVKAMANYPSYDPANYGNVDDAAVFTNAAAAVPLEIGSIMKPLTAAAALNLGAVKADSTFYDARRIQIDDRVVTNVEEDGGAGVKSVAQILNLSLNTGATWLLMQMGGGELNQKARTTWYDYMTEHYRFGTETGIEQGYEAAGYVPSPTKGDGLNITYANTSFGQAMTATPLQVAAAYSAMLNGGTYYQPHLVAGTIDATGKTEATAPKVLKSDVVSGQVSKEIQSMMEYVVANHRFERRFDTAYSVGGKTGTAELVDPATGVYYTNEFNGTYAGFVGGDDAEYIIVVVTEKPQIAGYAGSRAAQPLFADIAHMLLDNYNVPTKSGR